MAHKTILLLRHGKSAWDDASLKDFDRPLAPRGRRAAALMAAHMERAGLLPELTLCSPALRASETYAVMGRLWSAPPAHEEPDVYNAGPQAILARLRALHDAIARAMVLGHNPDLEDLAGLLVGDGRKEALKAMRAKFPTAALAVVRVDAERWTGVRPGTGYLDDFVVPKALI